jgi:hypothetical protein
MTGYLFSDFMNAVVWRMREEEALGNVRLTVQTPYFISNELQWIVYEALLQVLKEIPNEDFEGLSSLAVQSLSTTVSSGYAGVGAIVAPLNTIRVLGATVDTKSTVGSSPKSFVQAMDMIGGRWTNRWTMIGGKFLYIGTNAVFTVLTEPTLAQWMAASVPVLPPGYDIRAVDLAHKRVLIADYVPAWRP